jgi:transposase
LRAAADITGFITSACHRVRRDVISDEGAAGTVDAEYFLYWVKEYLCPVLGNYEFGEPRSVVILDNASTHMTEEVEEAITATGAALIYSAPYSPHLNPIENYFSLYKSYLKRNENRMHDDWLGVHFEALLTVDRDIGIKILILSGLAQDVMM